MAFFILEDKLSQIECIAFSKQFSSFSELIYIDSPVIVEGNISVREDEEPKILVRSIMAMPENNSFKKTDSIPKKAPTKLYLKVSGINSEETLRVLDLLKHSAGHTPAVFYDSATGKYLSDSTKVRITETLLNALYDMLGKNNVIVK